MKILQKRILSALLVVVMVVALAPFSLIETYAEEGPTEFTYVLKGSDLDDVSGSKTNNWGLTQTLTDDGAFRIEATKDCSGENYYDYGSTVKVRSFKGQYLVVKYRVSTQQIGPFQIYTNTVNPDHSYTYETRDSEGNPLYKAYKLNTDEATKAEKPYLNAKGEAVTKDGATIFGVPYTDENVAKENGYELIMSGSLMWKKPTAYTKSAGEIQGAFSLINDKDKEGGAEWHVAVVDLDKLLGTKTIKDKAGETGDYILDCYNPADPIKYFRLDLLNDKTIMKAGDYAEFAYVAVAKDYNEIKSVLQAKGDDKYCSHKTLETDADGNNVIDGSDTEHWNTCLICGSKANVTGHVVDESKQLESGAANHTATCKECGKKFSASHNGNGKLSYNTTTKKYDRLCECGSVYQAGETYFFVKKEAANISKPSNSTVVTDDGDFDYVRVVASADSSDFYWTPYRNGSNVETGNIFVMKYRLPATGETKNGNTDTLIYTSTTAKDAAEGQSFRAKMNNDGEWHLMVVDLAVSSKAITLEDGIYSVNFLRVGFGTEKKDNNVVDIAYLAFTDDMGAVEQFIKDQEPSAKVELEEGKTNCGACAGNGIVDSEGNEICIFCGVKVPHKHASNGTAVESPKTTPDANCHIELCISCGKEFSVAHTEDNVIIENSANGDKHTEHCKVCNAELSANHTWSSTGEYKDEKYHILTCACGASKDASHQADGTLVADGDKNSKTHTETCKVCAHTISVKHKLTNIEWSDEKKGYVGKCEKCDADGEPQYFLVTLYADQIGKANSSATVMSDDDGVEYLRIKGGSSDSNDFFWNAVSMKGNENKTGQYFVMKYRMPAGADGATNKYTYTTMFTSTSVNGAALGMGHYSPALNNNGKWQILVVDLAQHFTKDVTKDENGEYSINFIRLGFGKVAANYDIIDIAFIGLTDNITRDFNNYIVTKDIDLCSHSDQSFEKVDGNYVTTCNICEKELGKSPIQYLASGTELADKIKENGKTTNVEASDDEKYVTVSTPDGKDTKFYVLKNGAVNTGSFLIIKYSTNVMYLNIYAATVNGEKSTGADETWINTVDDEDWHIVVIDLSTEFVSEDYKFIVDEEGNYLVSYVQLGIDSYGKNEYINIEYVGLTSSLDEVKEFVTAEDLALCDHYMYAFDDECSVCGAVLVEEETETETETEEEETETETETETDTETDTETATESETDTVTATESETDTETETESQTETEAKTEAETEVVSGGCNSSGCGSTVGFGSVVIVFAMALTGASIFKKKED